MKKQRLRFWICVASAICGCLWVGFERLFAPHLSAQNGFLVFLGFGLIALVTTSPIFFQRFVGNATPESLGAIRVITCTILLIMTLWIEDLPSSALLPIEMRHSMGILNYFYKLPGFENFLRSQTSLQIFEWLTALVLFLGVIGWQTRIVVPLGAFCYLLLGGILRHYTWFFHTGLIPTYVMLILSVTPCGDGLSLDRLWRVSRGRTVPKIERALPIYGWSRYACWLVIAVPYVEAGMSKLRKGGFFWGDATNMRAFLYGSTLDPMQFDWGISTKLADAPDVLFALLGLAGLYGELAFGLVLFSKLARRIMPIFMAMTHIGIFFLQNILFLDLILLQLVFYDFTKIRQATKRWILGVSSLDQASTNDFDHLHQPSSNQKYSLGFQANKFFQSFFYPLIISGLVVTFIFCWSQKREFYPLTSMQMFSGRNTSGTVGYVKVLAHSESGDISRFYPEKIVPALFDTRYRLVIKGCLGDNSKQIQTCNKFLSAVGSAFNRQASLEKRISKLEIQGWMWDFRSNPSDFNYGKLKSRHIHKLEN